MTQICGQTLSGDIVSSLSASSRVLQVFNGFDPTVTPTSTLSTQLWKPDAIVVMVSDAGATPENGDFLVVMDYLGLTRDHVSVFIVGGTTMCRRNTG